MCPGGPKIKGFRLRVEGEQGRDDDTATNGIQMTCLDDSVLTYEGMWGEWGTYTECPTGTFVCGIQTQVQGDQGRGDDTALNQVSLRCCD